MDGVDAAAASGMTEEERREAERMAAIAARAEARAKAGAAGPPLDSSNGADGHRAGAMPKIAPAAAARPVYVSKADREAQALERLRQRRADGDGGDRLGGGRNEFGERAPPARRPEDTEALPRAGGDPSDRLVPANAGQGGEPIVTSAVTDGADDPGRRAIMRVSRRAFLRTTGSGVVAVAAAGAWRPAHAQKKQVVTIAFPETVTSMDPHPAPRNSPRESMYEAVFDRFLQQDRQGKYGPHIIESWQWTDGKMGMTVKIHQGVKFHDGSELTAEDVAFSMNRLKEIYARG